MVVTIITKMHFLREMLRQTFLVNDIGVAADESSPQPVESTGLEANPTLVLIDSSHPEGFAHLAKVRTLFPAIAVVVLAVTDQDEDFLAWADFGISGYIEPDTSTDQLVATIHRAAAGEVVCPPRLTSLLLKRFTSQSQSRAARGGIHDLTTREQEVLELLAEGLCNKRIARRLKIAESTVKNHVHSILEKCDVRSRGEAAAAYRRSNPEPVRPNRDAGSAARLLAPMTKPGGFSVRDTRAATGFIGQQR